MRIHVDLSTTLIGSFYAFRSFNSSIDATSESPGKARLVNHSRKNPNAIMKKVECSQQQDIRLILYALRDIYPHEEILYDYGERRRHAVQVNPWLKTT